jgi:hypothetical protein
MRNAGSATTGQHTHTVADSELLVSALRHSDQAAVVEFDGDFDAVFLGAGLFNRLTGQPAEDCPTDCSEYRGAITTAYGAAGYAARYCADTRTDTTTRTLNLHHTHLLNHSQANGLFAAHLLAVVIAATNTLIGAPAKSRYGHHR